jgi:hypothetical protein
MPMNFSPVINQSPGFRPGLLLCLCVWALALPALAQTNRATGPRTNSPAVERFLLVVETSAAMQKRATNVLNVVGRLFSSGANGQLDRGDNIGVWTYDSDLHTGQFPLQRWTPQTGREITFKLVQFIQQQRYARQSRLAPVMAQLTNVIADSDKITVILISDGSETPVGTTFDEEIAAAFKFNAAEQRRQAMPFVTILRAAKGKFVSLRVNTPPWPIELPTYPGGLDSISTTADTNPAPVRAETAPPPAPITPVAPEPATKPAETNLVASPPTNPPVVLESTPPPVEPPTNPSPAPAVVVTSKPVETVVASTKVLPTNPPPVVSTEPAVTAGKSPGKLPLLPILAGAGVVLVGLTVVCFALLRRSRAEPRVSLITRSMNKDGK